MDTILQDLRYALRTLARSPGFTAVAVLTLALGVGTNTAIFSVVEAVLLKPLPYPHADRLVSLDTKVPGPGKDIYGMAMSYPDIQQLQALTKDFAGVAAYTYARYNYAGRDQASELAATVVSPNLFGVLGVSPAVGRVHRRRAARSARRAELPHVGHSIRQRPQHRGPRDQPRRPELHGCGRHAARLRVPQRGYPAVGAAGRGAALPSAGRVQPPVVRLRVRGTPDGGRHARAGARRRWRGGAAHRCRRAGVPRRPAEGGRCGERPLCLAGAVRRGGAGAVDRLRQRGGAVRGARHRAQEGDRRAPGARRRSRAAGAAAADRERGGGARRGGRGRAAGALGPRRRARRLAARAARERDRDRPLGTRVRPRRLARDGPGVRTAAGAPRGGPRRGGGAARRGRRHDGLAPAPQDAERAGGGGDRARTRAAGGLGAAHQELRAVDVGGSRLRHA